MEPVSGIDANFLYLETQALHMHTLKVVVVEPGPEGLDFEALLETLERRLGRLAPFRQRLAWVPFGLTHPFWVEDRDFDIRFHVSRRRAPGPGGHHELCAVVAEVAGLPLDRSRPLWEMTLVEGLRGGRVAFVTKLHHAIADGARAVELLEAALRDEPAAPRPGEAVPGRRALLRSGLGAVGRRLRALPRLLWETLGGLLRLLRRPRPETPSALRLPGPPTSFNRALGPERTFATTRLPLDELRRIKRRQGVTLNDAVLAVCAGALRRYLGERGELVQRSLVVGVPTNARETALGPSGGNHLGHLIASLRTDLADPVERLHAIHHEMQEAKARDTALGPGLMERWAEYTPPGPTRGLMRVWSRWGLGSRVPPPINLVVSNVPGPPQQLAGDGWRIAELASVGPILEGIGLNLTAWSYAGQLQVAALGCPETLPDPWKLVELLRPALEELAEASSDDEPGGDRAREGVGAQPR